MISRSFQTVRRVREAWKWETYVRSQSFSSQSAVKYLYVGRRKIQISPPLGEQDQSNALPKGQQRHSNPYPMPCLPAGITLIGALRLNESCWPKILYRKNYNDKKGSKSFQQQRRMFCGNLDDLLWKYCKSRNADLSCSDVHWNFWRMCNALWLGSEVCNWYRLAISPIRRRRSTNV